MKVSIRETMRTFRCSVALAAPLDAAFRFFSDAKNLEVLTPASLRFRVVTEGDVSTFRGTRIDYRRRLRGLPLRWRSEITAWEPPHRFVDEHAAGSYRSWVHERRFEARERPGRDPVVVAHDEVHHQAPGGRFVNRFLIAPDLGRDPYRKSLARLPQPWRTGSPPAFRGALIGCRASDFG